MNNDSKTGSVCQEEKPINIRVFDVYLASELGINSAVVIQQIHFWTSMGMGVEYNNRVYIYNTYKQWRSRENFPFLTKNQLEYAFKKLVGKGILFKRYSRGYNRTCHYSINYEHDLIKYACLVGAKGTRNIQKWDSEYSEMDSGKFRNGTRKIQKSIHTDTTTKDQKQPTENPVGFSKNGKTTTGQGETMAKEKTRPGFANPKTFNRGAASKKSKSSSSSDYKEHIAEATSWLQEQPKDFQKQAGSYAEDQINSKPDKVNHPQAYKNKILVEIWKKYTDQSNHTDFEYNDKSKLKPSSGKVLTFEKKLPRNQGFEDEMMELYERGELCN